MNERLSTKYAINNIGDVLLCLSCRTLNKVHQVKEITHDLCYRGFFDDTQIDVCKNTILVV